MKQEALTAAHKHFTDTGYDGDLAKFSALLSSNKEAFNASFNYFKETGYDGDEAKFSNLL